MGNKINLKVQQYTGSPRPNQVVGLLDDPRKRIASSVYSIIIRICSCHIQIIKKDIIEGCIISSLKVQRCMKLNVFLPTIYVPKSANYTLNVPVKTHLPPVHRGHPWLSALGPQVA